MAYFSRSAKYTCPTYHIIAREPKAKACGTSGGARHRPPSTPLGSRSSSSNQMTTPKALVRMDSTNFDDTQQNYNAVQSSQSVHGSSKASTPGDAKAAVKEYFDDCDDGNITVQRGSTPYEDEVTIHVNRPSILLLRGRSRSNDWEVVELSDASLGKNLIRASSVADFRKEYQKELKDQVDNAESFIPETDLAGLATCMRLESHLGHLKRILRLFLDFDKLSKDSYNTDTLHGFLRIIHDCSKDIYHDLKSLTLWRSLAHDGPAYRILPLVETTARLQEIWDKYVHWVAKVSNRKIEDAAEGEYALRTYLWQQRQDACMETAKKMLVLLGNELDDGLEEVDKIEVNLKRSWRYGMKGSSMERDRYQWCGTGASSKH
ncbi:hypothetical protein JMJ35_003329 [Cladonia borealis]|uniref:Uncharacterized protein n=1 Tax=Cladonia borealis TaxID=184061 RepID=A0AA39R4H6_9LECA|nr:hypothetical protein JMJ35_003329 [Cladonia borealis]